MGQHPAKPRFLTVEQVAEELNVGIPQIRSLIKSRELRALQIGGRGLWRVGVVDVEAYISAAYEQTAERIAAGEVPEDGADEETGPLTTPVTAEN